MCGLGDANPWEPVPGALERRINDAPGIMRGIIGRLADTPRRRDILWRYHADVSEALVRVREHQLREDE